MQLLGIIVLEFSSMEEMAVKMKNMTDWVKVKIDGF